MPETVLITGASSGIGLELAHRFAADGSRLVLNARGQEALQRAAETIAAEHGVETHVLAMDLTARGAPQEIFDRLTADGIL